MNDAAESAEGSTAVREAGPALHVPAYPSPLPTEAPGGLATAPNLAAISALSSRREHLLHQVQRDRDELADVASRLRGPIRTLETAKQAVVFTARTLRWITLAGEVIAVASWLRTGRRPPLALLVGISLQLFGALSGRSAPVPPSAVSRRAP